MDAIEGMWLGNDASGVLSKPVMVRRGKIGSAGGIVNEAWIWPNSWSRKSSLEVAAQMFIFP